MPSEYLDFDLKIDKGTPPIYPVSVVRSPMGKAREEMTFAHRREKQESS